MSSLLPTQRISLPQLTVFQKWLFCVVFHICVFLSALPPFSFLAVPVTKVIHTFIECTERAPNDPLTATSGSLAGERKHPELHYISGAVPSSPLPVCSHTFQRTGYIFLRKKSFSPQEVRSVWRATCLWIGRGSRRSRVFETRWTICHWKKSLYSDMFALVVHWYKVFDKYIDCRVACCCYCCFLLMINGYF